MDQIFIQHRFKIEQDGRSFSDALVMPKEEYDKLTPEEIETQKQARYDNWVYVIEHPEPAIELPLVDQLENVESQLADLQAQIDYLSVQKTEIENKISITPEEEIA